MSTPLLFVPRGIRRIGNNVADCNSLYRLYSMSVLHKIYRLCVIVPQVSQSCAVEVVDK